jgi:hypothetical protein
MLKTTVIVLRVVAARPPLLAARPSPRATRASERR